MSPSVLNKHCGQNSLCECWLLGPCTWGSERWKDVCGCSSLLGMRPYSLTLGRGCCEPNVALLHLVVILSMVCRQGPSTWVKLGKGVPSSHRCHNHSSSRKESGTTCPQACCLSFFPTSALPRPACTQGSQGALPVRSGP